MFYQGMWRSISALRINFIIKILILSDFLIWSATNLVNPIFAIFVTNKWGDGAIETVGIATMIYLVTRSILEVPVGIKIDRTKSEKDNLVAAVLGTAIMGLVYFFYPLISFPWQLYLLQAVYGAGTACAFPGWYSLFTRHVDQTKAAFEWSLFDVVIGIGMAITAALGAFLVERYGFDCIFIVVGILHLIGSLLLILIRNRIFIAKNN